MVHHKMVQGQPQLRLLNPLFMRNADLYAFNTSLLLDPNRSNCGNLYSIQFGILGYLIGFRRFLS